MLSVPAYGTDVYSSRQEGLYRLLAYALHPKNYHSYQWVSPLLTHLFSRDTVPDHRCVVCGAVAPRCRCWNRATCHA